MILILTPKELGVRSQPTPRPSPSQPTPRPSPSQEGKKEEETPSRRRKFFGRVKVTEFYRTLIWTWYHTSNYQRPKYHY
ncbi:MAG: hypothetical protein F6K48_11645 [Okeania sp. SIO3H1]|nr:hypothetical protein [Okeania sp. SIO3H1]